MGELDCGIVIALPEEYEGKPGLPGFEETFSVTEPGFSIGVNVFRKFTFRSIAGQQRVGIYSILHGMGPAPAMDVTKAIVQEFDPPLMVNIGISGSLDQHVRLGDLVAAESSYDYTYRGKETDFGRKLGGKPYTSYYPIFNITRQFWITNEDEYWEWRKRCSRYLERAISTSAREQLVREGLLVAYPGLHGGPVVCGNDVVASEELRQLLLSQNRNYLAADMESAGFLQGCHEQYFERPRLVLRAISDLADHRKEKMDGIEAGGIRAWAMGNAYQMLAILLEQAIQIEHPPKATTQVPSSIPAPRQKLEATVHALIADK